MIALVLAGGFATRLYPLTKNFPKPLLDVGGKPIIEHIIEKLEEIKSIEKIIISTNKKFESFFFDWVKNTTVTTKEILVEVENAFEEKEKPGAIQSIAQTHQRYPEDFLIVGGDNFFEDKLVDLVNVFETKKAPIIGIYKNTSHFDSSQFGTVKMDKEGMVRKFVEKSVKPTSNLVSTCIYAIPKNSLTKINSYLNNNNPDSPGHFIRWLSENETVYGSILQGLWSDIGTIQAYNTIKKQFA